MLSDDPFSDPRWCRFAFCLPLSVSSMPAGCCGPSCLPPVRRSKIWDAAHGPLGLTRHEESISRTRFRDETKTSPPTMSIVSTVSLRLGTDISCMSVARQSHPMLVAHLEKTGVLLPVPTKVPPNLRKDHSRNYFRPPSHRIRGTETFERLTFHLALFLFVVSCRRERCVVRFEGRYGRSVGQYRFKAMAKEGSESRHRIEKRSASEAKKRRWKGDDRIFVLLFCSPKRESVHIRFDSKG